jgi:SAM-dependent methyltransferase
MHPLYLKGVVDWTNRRWCLVGWEEAGRGWGARALDWAYLNEPYARVANDLIFERVGVGAGTRYLDIACGSGMAASTARRRGADVAGIDASEALIRIASARTPDGDFRVGDMFDLPFAPDSFDVVTSFNGIWKGCERALIGARRVLANDGRLGLTFWGRLDRIGLMPYFMKIIELSPSSHQSASMEQGDTGRVGVVEDMLVRSGFNVIERGTVEAINEWPDVATAVRALAAAGPAVPAIELVGYDAFCAALDEILSPLYDADLGVRIVSELGWVTAQSS